MADITTVILIKDGANRSDSIHEHYTQRLVQEGIDSNEVSCLPLLYNNPKKVLAKTAKAYLDRLILQIPGTTTRLIIADSSYFKFITGQQKVSSFYGAVVTGKEGTPWEKFNCVYVPNYNSLFKQPENAKLIDVGIKTIAGTASTVRLDTAIYVTKYGHDVFEYDRLHQYPELAVDIETTGLHLSSLVQTVAFAWSCTEGVAINLAVCGTDNLKEFLETYKGKLIFHNGLFDAKLLIRALWMKHPNDYVGMLEGLKFFRTFDDTMIMRYLAENATTDVPLGLKESALEYVGNYALDITDITKHTVEDVLRYNLVDCLGTFWLYDKYRAQLTTEPYLTIFQPSLYLLLKIMLVGLPIHKERTQRANETLRAKELVVHSLIHANPYIQTFEQNRRVYLASKANEKLKKLRKTPDDFADEKFNPNSTPQKAQLLFEQLNLPILDKTKSGAPATGADVLKDLYNHTSDPDILELLKHFQEYDEVTKINNTFIRAFLNDEEGFIHGNQKLGGTQSGRLASDNPNLANLPSHGKMGKLIKSCVVGMDGYFIHDKQALDKIIQKME